jgi:toxin HigB-1
MPYVIKSFADKRTERLFYRKPAKGLPAELQRIALRKLRQIDAATDLDSLRVPPGNRLELLRGDRAGPAQYPRQRPMAPLFRVAEP